jgi:hypothetical protein
MKRNGSVRNLIFVVAAGLSAALAVGCAKSEPAPGPAEKAGKAVDKAATDAAEAAKKAGDATKDAAQKTGEAVKEGAQKAGDAAKDAAHKAADAVNTAVPPPKK